MFSLSLQRFGFFVLGSWILGLWFLGGLLSNAAVASAKPAQSQGVLSEVADRAEQRRDPTQPPGVPGRARADYSAAKGNRQIPVLTSILLSSERRLAVINDTLVREGGVVAGMTLVRVGKDEVQLQGKNQTQALVLRLAKPNIEKDYR